MLNQTMRRRQFVPVAATGLLLARETRAATLRPIYRRPPGYEAFRDRISGSPREAESAKPTVANPLFADVTGTVLASEQLSRGTPYWLAHLDPATGIDIYGNNGVAVGDIDGDGVDEIFVCQPAGLPNKLFRWQSGRLTDIATQSGVDLLDDTTSALFLDLRNIGRQDLVVLRGGAGPLLFLNDGVGKFSLVADAFRFARAPRGSFTGMAAADFDRDGKLDLYVCCYSFFQSEAQFTYPTPYFDAQNGPPNFLFRNRLTETGGGFFEDVTTAVGLDENNNRFSFAPAWCDYDGSGWPSLYVANDFGRNNLYRNERGRFRDVAAEAGVEDIGPGMSAAWFDATGDGRPDLYIANMWTRAGQRAVASPEFGDRFPAAVRAAWRGHTKGNSLYRNRGDGRFDDVGAAMGVEMGRWAWSADAADFDNDGRPEIFVTCGMFTNSREPDLEDFFWREVVTKSPPDATRNEAYEAGWNALNQFVREGFGWHGGERNVFYRPDAKGAYADASHASGLDFAGDSRAFAITDIDGDGCLDLLVKSRLGPQLRVFQNRCGIARSRVGIRLTGSKSNRDAIGARVRVAGQTKWITAGSGYLSQHTKTLYFGLPNTAAGANCGPVEILWPSGVEQRVSGLTAGALFEIQESTGQATRVRQFAASRPIERRPARGDNSMEPADVWLLDPVPLPEPRKGPGVVVITEEYLRDKPDLAAAYSLFRRYLLEHRTELTLPLALLLDANGHAIKLYATPPAGLVERGSPAPLPYPGRALGRGRRDYFKLAAALAGCGYGDYALPYLDLTLRNAPDNTRALVLAAQIYREAGRLDQAQSHLDRALDADSSLAEAWNEAGGVAMARERLDEALSHFDRALAIKPDLLYALLNAARVSESMGRAADSERFYRRAWAAHPRSAEAANGLGLLLAKSRRSGEAEPLLRRATELDPTLWNAWNNLAILCLQTQRPLEAEKALENGIRIAPLEETLYLNLGRMYVQAGDRERARKTMLRLLEAKPDSDVARKALADLERRQP